MIKNLEPIYFNGLDCFSSLIVSYLNYLNLPYQELFFDEWNFSYKKGSYNIFNLHICHIQTQLQKLFSLQIQSVSFDIQTLLCSIKKEKPMILKIDHYYCPWHPAYKINYWMHFILIVGLEDENFICVDPIYNVSNGKLPLSILQTYGKALLDFVDADIALSKQDDNTLYKNLIFNEYNTFAEIMDFSEEINVILKDSNTEDKFFYFLDKVEELTNGCYCFSEYLAFLTQYKGINLDICSNSFRYEASQWNIVRNFLYKNYLSKSLDSLDYGSIKSKLSRLAEIDHSNYLLLKEHIVKPLYVKKNLPFLSFPQKSIKDFSWISLDIMPFVNNLGWGDQTIISNLTPFWGLYKKDFPPHGIVQHASHKIKLINSIKADNISCNGQEINVELDNVEGLFLIGCSEEGASIDIIEIYSEQVLPAEKVIIKFSEFYSAPSMGEKIFYQARVIHNETGIISHFKHNILLSQCHFKNQYIKKIKLPININLHIFAIGCLCNKSIY